MTPNREPLIQTPPRAVQLRVIRWVVRALALVLGAAQGLAHRYEINADGISYLDAGDAWARGDWAAAINAYWSPMYSWLLELVTAFTPPISEAPMTKIANLIALVLAMVGFELFWKELSFDDDDQPRRALRDVSAGILALWAFLALIGVILLTPDLLVAGFALTAFALLLRAFRTGSIRAYAVLGAVLAAGYYGKSVMFPVSLITLVAAGLMAWQGRRGWRGPALSGVVFAALAAPLVIALSVQKGRVTFGDSGRINFAFYVNGVPGVTHWRGGPPGAGMPMHPTREISGDPYAYEFGAPVAGTYPPWYDPSYWYDGITPHPDIKTQLWLLRQHAVILAPLVWPALATFVLVLVAGGAARETLRALAARWPPALVAFGAITMYSIVYVEERYIAAFVLVLYLWLLASIRVRSSRVSVVPLACVLLVAPLSRPLYARVERDLFDANMLLRGVWHDDNGGYRIAEALWRAGVPRGANIAMIGTGTHAYWARLAGIRVVAEVPHVEVFRFWYLGPAKRNAFLDAMAAASGATWVLADEPPEVFGTRGWRKLGVDGLLIRPLQPGNEMQPTIEEDVRRKRIQPESLTKERRP